MKILAVDYGDARTGLAVCDATELLASPAGQLEEKNMAKAAQKILEACRQHGAERIVLGLPRNMDGTEGARAQKTRALAALLAEGGVPVRLWDERRTTVSAAALLTQNGSFGKKRKAKLDAVSAAVILEGYLAFRKNHPDEE